NSPDGRPLLPLLEIRQGVDDVAAVVPGPLPDLEVQVVTLRVARVADAADALTLVDVLPLDDGDRAILEVHEGVVQVLAVAREDHVTTRAAGLEADVDDRA